MARRSSLLLVDFILQRLSLDSLRTYVNAHAVAHVCVCYSVIYCPQVEDLLYYLSKYCEVWRSVKSATWLIFTSLVHYCIVQNVNWFSSNFAALSHCYLLQTKLYSTVY